MEPQNSLSPFLAIAQHHAARYPAMEPQDYGKLAYQSTFGPEHLLTDPDQVIPWIAAEMQEADAGAPPEDIGGGLCRMYLDRSWPKEAPPLLARLMVRTARETHGTQAELADKLSLLEGLPVPGMAAWLAQWQAAGCPAMHHSGTYRKMYHPHYRLLRQSYAVLFPLLLEISAWLSLQSPLVLAIDGRCGSGKTWLSDLLAGLFPCRVIHMDDFYRPMDRRAPNWKEIPAGNMDLERLQAEVLVPAQAGEDIPYRPYSCQEGAYRPVQILPAQPLTVIEGSYSLHPQLQSAYHRSLFLTCAPEVQARRLQRREGAHYTAFVDTWIPLEERYIQACAPEKACTRLVDTSRFF